MAEIKQSNTIGLEVAYDSSIEAPLGGRLTLDVAEKLFNLDSFFAAVSGGESTASGQVGAAFSGAIEFGNSAIQLGAGAHSPIFQREMRAFESRYTLTDRGISLVNQEAEGVKAGDYIAFQSDASVVLFDDPRKFMQVSAVYNLKGYGAAAQYEQRFTSVGSGMLYVSLDAIGQVKPQPDDFFGVRDLSARGSLVYVDHGFLPDFMAGVGFAYTNRAAPTGEEVPGVTSSRESGQVSAVLLWDPYKTQKQNREMSLDGKSGVVVSYSRNSDLDVLGTGSEYFIENPLGGLSMRTEKSTETRLELGGQVSFVSPDKRFGLTLAFSTVSATGDEIHTNITESGTGVIDSDVQTGSKLKPSASGRVFFKF